MKVAFIGFGAIGTALARALRETEHPLVGILGRATSLKTLREKVPASISVVSSTEHLLALSPQIVVECAGHEALRVYGGEVLRAGINVIVSSVGALADPALEMMLLQAAAGGGRLIIPSGAMGGLDALGAARRAGLDQVLYTSRKAPSAWRGTKAEALVDLRSINAAQVFYEGSARQAALDFPQNANVVAAVALAGIGFDRTQVRLLVDPQAAGNRHILEARGAFGEISASVLTRTLPENPKTSMLTPYSLVRAISNVADAFVV
ncbi:MAG TPA: aspartate dehydrogenase [Bradyrhizobium sp.]|jgi:aspartate dehydrogenase|nr:aspartate dehydrogenase [Bradyrhizobium sp.]